MKLFFLVLALTFELFGAVLESPVLSVDKDLQEVTIKTQKVEVGVSGFISHKIAQEHGSILKNVVVKSYDPQTQIATLKMSNYDALRNNSLPTGRWEVEIGDIVVLAYGYNRGVLIAPTEEIYYRLSRGLQTVQWLHPDIFATLLSYEGHPTPLKSDFDAFSKVTSIGLVFFYLNNNLFTLDAKTFKILNITNAPLKEENVKLPFYTRVEHIDADWWGEGSDELESYEPHYYSLMIEHNKENKKLYDIVKENKFDNLLKKFELKEDQL